MSIFEQIAMLITLMRWAIALGGVACLLLFAIFFLLVYVDKSH